MSLPSLANVNISVIDSKTTSFGKSFLFDFNTGDFSVVDGKIAEVENEEALKVWIQKVIRTEKNRFKIYEDIDYGIAIEDLVVGQIYEISFIKEELGREITEALLKNPLIKSVTDFEIKKDDFHVIISFTVNTDRNTISTEVSF